MPRLNRTLKHSEVLAILCISLATPVFLYTGSVIYGSYTRDQHRWKFVSPQDERKNVLPWFLTSLGVVGIGLAVGARARRGSTGHS